MSTRHAFPTCCGITIVSGFDNRTDTLKLTKAGIEVLKQDLENQKTNGRGVGLLLIAFNKHQVDSGYGKVASECGFLRMGRYFYHPGHGNNIQLYGYYYHPDKELPHPDAKKSEGNSEGASVTKAGAKKKALVKKKVRTFGD